MTYGTVKKQLVEQFGGFYTCKTCGSVTSHSTLSDHGARCFPCYQSYCRAVQSPMSYPPIHDGQRKWAYLLKAREDGGERLTSIQRAAWRGVIFVSDVAGA